MLLVLLWLPVSMMADDVKLVNSVQNPEQSGGPVTQRLLSGNAVSQLYGAGTKLKTAAASPSAKRQVAKVRRAAAAAPMDLTKATDCVMTYKTLISSGNDGGHAVVIAPKVGYADSITITNFY